MESLSKRRSSPPFACHSERSEESRSAQGEHPAGIQSVGAFLMACGVNSRFCGNDCTWEHPCRANDTTTRGSGALECGGLTPPWEGNLTTEGGGPGHRSPRRSRRAGPQPRLCRGILTGATTTQSHSTCRAPTLFSEYPRGIPSRRVDAVTLACLRGEMNIAPFD
jgi:hypothetical protein